MDLLPQVTCFACEKVFCCPVHRRKHENTAHSLTRKHQLRVRTQPESYALEIRKSYLFLERKEQHRSNNLSRKRKHSNFALRVSQITASNVDMGKRKIIKPKRNVKPLFQDTDMPKKAKGNQRAEKPTGSEDYEEEYRTVDPSTSGSSQENFLNEPPILPDDLISPVEPEGRAAKKSLASGSAQSQREEDDLNENKVFTSTPIQKKARTATNDVQDQPSAIPTTSKTEGGWLSRRRKVHFSKTGDSLYMTANEDSSSRRGIFSKVTNVIQSALKTLPGSSKNPEKMEIETEEEDVTEPPPMRFPPIRGRRALRPSLKDNDSS